MELFNAVTRFERRDLGTARWDEVPMFGILANVVVCPSAVFPDRTCPEWKVMSSKVPSAIMERILAVTTPYRH